MGHEDAARSQFLTDDIGIKVFRVELVARAAENGVREISDDHVETEKAREWIDR